MLDVFNKRLHIGISRDSMALLQASGWRRSRVTLLSQARLTAEHTATADRMAGQLGDMIAQARCANRAASIVLADDWVRLFMVTPPQNATRLQDCRAAAHMRFQALYGESPGDWQLEADWDVRRPFLACAMPRALLQALNTAASAHHVALIEVMPHFVAAWNRWHSVLKPDSWFGTACDNTLTLGVLNAQSLDAVRCATVPHDAWHGGQWLPEHVAREALRLHLPVPQRIQLCGSIPAHWTAQEIGSLTCERLDAALYVADLPQPASMALAQTGVCP